MPEKQVDCPECGHTFDPDEQVWDVCSGCGEIWGPDEEWSSHNWNDDVECDSPHATRRYSEEAAKELARERGNEDV